MTSLIMIMTAKITDIRIEEAKRILKNDQIQMKIYDIGYKVGYTDPRYFIQLFKKKVGTTPNRYRESM
jgi:two-component system response regulator YesN